MRKLWLAVLSGLMSGVWAALLTVIFFGVIPTIGVVFLSGLLSGVLGICTVLVAEKALRKG